MRTPEFDITIDSNGKMTVHIQGVPGKGCLDFANLLKELVGPEESRRLTSDYYKSEGEVHIRSGVRAPLVHQRYGSKDR